MKKLILLLFVILTFTVSSQQLQKLSPAFRYIVSNPFNTETQELYPTLYKQAFAKGLNTQTGLIEDGYVCIIYTSQGKLLHEKIQVQSVLSKFVTAWVTHQQLIMLTEMPEVSYIDVPKMVFPNNDIAVGTTGASLLHAGKLNNTQYKGDGIIVGVFDTGIDWDHLDFRSPTDTTKSRILKLWDQTITPIAGESSPSGFNYGVEYTQAHLNNELDGTPAGYVREKDLNGHGTHVAGTAAGNGVALSTKKFAGVAPNADLVIVKGGNGSFSDYDEINAMTYFQNVANALGKPIVINMSIGGQFGAHDGSNPDEIAVDNFCNSAAGRVACISAGNDNGISIHKQVSIAANSSTSVVINVPTASGSTATDVFQISLYVNDTSSVNATITLPNGSTIAANAGQSISPSVLSGAATAYFDNYIDVDSKDRLINLYVVRSSTTANPSGTWSIALTNTTNNPIRIDGWLNYKGTNFSGTTVTGSDNNYLVGSPGNCTSAITVASYVGKLDWYSTSTTVPGGYQYTGSTQQDNISTFSSRGPRRDDTQKPTIAATGQAVVSCLASDAGISASSNTVVVQGLYRAIQGTSMSSPVVAGCVALMLQTKPNATFNEIKNAITTTATKDNFTGASPNYVFGAGKIDVYKAASSLITCSTFKRDTYSYDSSTTSASNLSFTLGSNKAATRFTPMFTGKLGGVYFKTSTSVPVSSFTIEVRGSDGTNPSTLLGSLNVLPSLIAKFSWNYFDVTSLNINVVNGNDYWVVLVPGSGDNWGLGYESLSVSSRSKYFNGTDWVSYNDFRIRSVVYNNDVPVSTSITNVSSCNNYVWNGNTYNTSGIYTYTTTNSSGCDSIATLNLIVNQATSSTTNVSVCSNQLPYIWNGNSYNLSGTYNVTLTNSVGCDSVATLSLEVNQNFTIIATAGVGGNISPSGAVTVCEFADKNFVITPNSGYSISNVIVDGINKGSINSFYFFGVISNHTIDVTFIANCSPSSSTSNITVCDNQLPYSWNGQLYNSTGTYLVHLTNNGGCDSAATLNLNVLSTIPPTIKNSSSAVITNATMCTITGTLNLYGNGVGVWSSNNTAIASVSSNGRVTAVANGTASVKYTVTNANGCQASATVTINVATVSPPNPIAGVSNLCVGSSATYVSSTSGGIWSTLGRASISSNGIATGTNAGSTSIIYKIINSFNCSASTSLNLTVNALPAVPSISFASGTSGVTGSGGYCKNKTFTLLGTPSAGVWSSTGVITVDSNGVVNTGNVTGAASIKYTITDNKGCSNSRTFTSSVVNCGSRGVNTSEESLSFNMYPNPAIKTVNVKVDKLVGKGKVLMFDILGKQLFEQPISLGLNTIDLSLLSKGIYFVSVISNDAKKNQKLVVY